MTHNLRDFVIWLIPRGLRAKPINPPDVGIQKRREWRKERTKKKIPFPFAWWWCRLTKTNRRTQRTLHTQNRTKKIRAQTPKKKNILTGPSPTDEKWKKLAVKDVLAGQRVRNTTSRRRRESEKKGRDGNAQEGVLRCRMDGENTQLMDLQSIEKGEARAREMWRRTADSDVSLPAAAVAARSGGFTARNNNNNKTRAEKNRVSSIFFFNNICYLFLGVLSVVRQAEPNITSIHKTVVVSLLNSMMGVIIYT